jgi:hypothetical protein
MFMFNTRRVRYFVLTVALSLVPLAVAQQITTAVGNGSGGFTGDGGPATAAAINYPYGLTIDQHGSVFFGDHQNHRVRKVDPAGVITTVAGDGSSGPQAGPARGDGGLAINAGISYPSAVAVDSEGNLFIASYYDNLIRKVFAQTGIITTVAGNGQGFGFGGDGGPATAASLYRPFAVAVDPSGNLYISDTYNHRIRRVDAATGIITTVAGTGTPLPPFADLGDGGPATSASLAFPAYVAIDKDGNLFIADGSHQRIRKVESATGIITTVAGNGVESYGGDGGPATQAAINNPAGVAVDSAGNIFIAELYSHRVRKVDAATNIISTIAGTGAGGYNGDGGPAVNAMLYYPAKVALYPNGDLLVSDTTNNRIRKISSAGAIPDASAPTLSCGAADGLWHGSDVSVTCTASDGNGSGLLNAGDSTFSLSTAVDPGTENANASTGTREVCDKAGNCVTAGPINGNKVDKNPPTLACGTADGVWHGSDVSIACTASDGNGSGLLSASDNTFSLSTSVGAGTEDANASTGTREVCDKAGNCATAGPISGNKVDKNPPTITITAPTSTGSYLLNQTSVAAYTCADGGSGIASCTGPVASGANVSTSTANTNTFSVTATDRAGNTSTTSVTYGVHYTFLGFFQPVDMGTVLNIMTAGRAVPLKWQLQDATGAPLTSVTTASTLTSAAVPCSGGATDVVEEQLTSAGDTAVIFDGQQFRFVWKTSTAWAGTCRRVTLLLSDGTRHTADFQLR